MLTVFGLCAQWCGSCRGYEPAFAQLQQRYPQVRFVWLDVEEPAVAAVLDDWEVETFPTIVAGVGERCFFKGAVLPSIEILERMLQNWLQELQALEPESGQWDAMQALERLLKN